MTAVSFVIPCFQSGESLIDLCEDIIALARERSFSLEIVLVLDSREIAASTLMSHPVFSSAEIRIIELSRNFGQHNALVAGITRTAGDVVVTVDDDYQHNPSDALILVDKLLDDASIDLVYGVPVQSQQSLTRSFAGSLMRTALRLSGMRHARMIGPFRAFRGIFRGAFESLQGPNVSVDVVLSRVVESAHQVPVDFLPRSSGVSGYSVRSLIRLATTYLTSQSVGALNLSIFSGLAGLTLTLGAAGYTLVSFLAGEISEPGFTTLALLVAFTGSVQLFSLGVIGYYIGQQHQRGISSPVHFVLRDSRDSHDPNSRPRG